MSKIIPIIAYEEGYKEHAYIDTEGYPTIGCGIVIGPKNAPLENYIFNVPRNVGEVWMQKIIDQKIAEINSQPSLRAALNKCNQARADVLYSMAYQLGVSGLCAFKNMLVMISEGNFDGAADAMLNSRWAKQTPARARRHAQVMRTGTYQCYQGVI
ncbi:glycoside hydrolase family protein [Erwinia oleae]|uniref:glycoside hydrolase family protein n=1 Tax=Erwinia oleae TaxID=796334 RepID=UPI000550CE88|nr:glycoside hydrolase family protein [Erwinia oleae]